MSSAHRYMPDSLDFEYEGHTFLVTIDSDGTFWTEWNGDGIQAVSYGLLKKKVMIAYQPVTRCAIPAMRGRSSSDLKRITLIGFHAGNRNFLYKFDSEKEDRDTQQAYHNSEDIYPVLTKAQIAEWRALEKADRDAGEAVRRWTKQHRMKDPLNVVRQALGMPRMEKEHEDDDG